MLNGGSSGRPGSPPGSPGNGLDWNFSQVFGERAPGEEVQEADIISAVEFDRTGQHLATGDRGGRVVLFEMVSGSNTDPDRKDSSTRRGVEYRYLTEFQSHEPEFDYLKSLEIEEKINKIRWCQGSNGAHMLLSTNDKTIKLWKVHEKKVKCVSSYNIDPQPGYAPFREDLSVNLFCFP
ncbi:Serine/threonine protein phosphatase 2A 55 kDa regulatory subunit B beta isoform [Cymbomonas tetramitiformis]|uniref:Serine/threonine protein phosphatase 2A 55 kDa regulatory subunit B beta isoform n=1 Tax=Cymbomonas tetramitiformis TaxID=36881 RepID=A0AAE0G4I6_9CHLO|nr:Serine/threonine protein phosphatase 2A 55 kDa regulatory subunit B beta isoform [Cymbomonas tetramitiformis]